MTSKAESTTSQIAEPDDVTDGAAEYAASIRDEWSQYRALVPLTWDGVPAVPAGAAVPASHPGVRQWLEDKLIEKIG